MKNTITLIYAIGILFVLASYYCGVYTGKTIQESICFEEKIKTAKANINTSEFTKSDTLSQDTIYSLEITLPDTILYQYYRIQAVGTGKLEYIFGYYVDSVTQRQITIEY